MLNKELLKKLQTLSKEELEKEAVFITACRTQSGIVNAKKLPYNLYNTYEDDPNELKSKKQLKDEGMDNEEIEECGLEFEKGRFFFEIQLNF